MRVGFIGLGRMGMPMSRNLLRGGFELVVHNRSRKKVEQLVAEGARAASSPAEVAEASDVVLACLPTVEATEEVFLGEEGVVRHARDGQILVDHSTIGPGTARRVAAAARQTGASFLDAPVSGGPDGAQAATLTIMVGGAPEAFEQVAPVLRAMGRNVRRVGDVGSGCVAKLANQHLCFVHTAVAAEAITLAGRCGVDPHVLLEILQTSWGQSRMLERSVPRFVERNFESGAPLRLYRKDLGLVAALAEEMGVAVPLADAAIARLRAALARGLEESDLTALVIPYEEESRGQAAGGG